MPTKAATSEVDKYIASCEKQAQGNLAKIRAAIRAAAPGATERTDYFEMPGYSYPGFDYDGMFAWFSCRKGYVRLHVRPPVIQEHSEELADFPTTKAIVSFPMDQPVPLALVKKLVKASIRVMKDRSGEWWFGKTGLAAQHWRELPSCRHGNIVIGASTSISTRIAETEMPFLDGLHTDREILALYNAGLVMRFEVDRDETRVVLAAHLGMNDEVSQLLADYEARCVAFPTSERAGRFLAPYKARFGLRCRVGPAGLIGANPPQCPHLHRKITETAPVLRLARAEMQE
jgi:uncharacterized protein YdhG (YjbR/CyaY superfamily)